MNNNDQMNSSIIVSTFVVVKPADNEGHSQNFVIFENCRKYLQMQAHRVLLVDWSRISFATAATSYFNQK